MKEETNNDIIENIISTYIEKKKNINE